MAEVLVLVDVIIINYNQERELLRCVESVKGSAGVELSSIRVRNTGKHCAAPGALVTDGKNIGYGAACNEQARQCRGEYLLFLNADIILPENALSLTLSMLQADPKAGLCGLKMAGQASRMRFPTPWQLAGRSLGLGRGYAAQNQCRSGKADWVLGAYLLVKRTAFEAVGGFDPGFFLYFEEVDLSLRLKKAGFHCLY